MFWLFGGALILGSFLIEIPRTRHVTLGLGIPLAGLIFIT